jgi:RND family efflux transporter MFP subunit
MARPVLRRAVWTVAALSAIGLAGYLAQDHLAELLAGPAPDAAPEAAVVAPRPAQPVRVTRAHFAAVEATSTYTGTIRPQDEVPLSFRIPGKLTARLVEVGDSVVEGQVLARLDDTDTQLELAAAKAELAAARTDLDRAEADVTRSRKLFSEGHIAQAALDRAVSAVAEAQSRADRAERAVDLAANRLAYTSLVAEADGVVTETFAEAGEVVAAGQRVLSAAETGHVDVVFALPEQHRDLLAETTATASLWGREDHTYALALRDISPDVDPVGRTYRVRMTLTHPDAEAALGRTATVRLSSAKGQPVVVLPMTAVLNVGSGAAVWRVPAGTDRVERVTVEIVGLDGQVAQVRGALAEGDLVVSLGAHKVDPMRPVRVVETSLTPDS